MARLDWCRATGHARQGIEDNDPSAPEVRLVTLSGRLAAGAEWTGTTAGGRLAAIRGINFLLHGYGGSLCLPVFRERGGEHQKLVRQFILTRPMTIGLCQRLLLDHFDLPGDGLKATCPSRQGHFEPRRASLQPRYLCYWKRTLEQQRQFF